MSHYARPVNADIALVTAYPTTGTAVIHAEGCSHAKGNRNVREAIPHSLTEAVPYEDYYDVAPCAATGKGGGKYVCQQGGCGVCD